MPSPFPGMDPYIEASDLWADFHQKLISEVDIDYRQPCRPPLDDTAVKWLQDRPSR